VNRLRSWLRAVLARRRDVFTLLVPVPEADSPLEAAGAPRGEEMPRHVTLLFPFRPAGGVTDHTVAELSELLGRFRSFAFRLARTGRFPGVLYLEPEPAARFRDLTEALVARWPESLPYEGAYDEVVPHLTVIDGGAEADGLEAEVVRRLPIDAVAGEVWLLRQHRGRWGVRARFPLAASASG